MHNKNKPTVSVVMATFNRSNLLQFSIGSLLKNTFQDWELIVVGDCCTDDTEHVVASFNDPRIQFINLVKNVGEQSGPNNIGVSLAKGKYIAFLNHDDMWCSNHLQCNLDFLMHSNADLVFSQSLFVPHSAALSLQGATTGCVQLYQPWMSVPATLWLFKQELYQKVGGWHLSKDIRAIPSQEWLYRAHRAKVTMLANPNLTAVILNSGSRMKAYSERQSAEHDEWYPAVNNPGALMQAVSAAFGAHLQHTATMGIGLGLRRFIGLIARKMMIKIKIWPADLTYWIKYYRKGSFIQELRKRRGL